MFSSQGDSPLLFIHDPGAAGQTINQLPGRHPGQRCGVGDGPDPDPVRDRQQANKVYAITSNLPWARCSFPRRATRAWPASWARRPDTGTITPIATGFGSPRACCSSRATGSRPDGYHLVAADGGVFSFGDAGFFGSIRWPAPQCAGGRDGHHRRPGWLPPGRRRWRVFSFGDAGFFWVHRRRAAQQGGGGHGAHASGQRLLAGRRRRWGLRLRRRRVLRLLGATLRGMGWCHRAHGDGVTATGWSLRRFGDPLRGRSTLGSLAGALATTIVGMAVTPLGTATGWSPRRCGLRLRRRSSAGLTAADQLNAPSWP